MINEYIITLIVLSTAVAFIWYKAGSVYESNHRAYKDHPVLFYLTGFNEKYIEDRALWIKHLRRQLLLVVVLFATLVLFIAFQQMPIFTP